MDPLRVMRGSVLLALLISAVLVSAEPRTIVPFVPDLVLIKGVGVVAVNPLVELCGLQMTEQAQVLTVTRQGKSFTCTLEKTAATQNGKPVTLKLAPFKRADAIYLPARPLIEALGGTLTFTQPAESLFPGEQYAMLSLPGLRQPLCLLTVTLMDSKTELRDQDTEVYIINLDGSGQRRLSYDEEPNQLPIVVPDGTLMLYPDHWRLMVRPLDTPYPRPLVSIVYGQNMVSGIIAPDSKRVLFVDADDAEKTRVGIINVDGTGKQILIYGDNPCFTPDGQSILYATDNDDDLIFASSQWHLMDLNGKHLRDFGKGVLPSFSADGAKLMLTRLYKPQTESETNFSLMPVVYQLTGENAGACFEAPAQQRMFWEHGSISPDGHTLLISRLPNYMRSEDKLPNGTREGIINMTFDRSEERLLWEGKALSPIYTPDGKYILFIQDDALYRMQADGSAVKRLTTDISITEDFAVPTFTPDGQQILFLASPMKVKE